MLFSWSLLWLPLGAFACCVVLHLLALRLFPRIGLMDFPERYGLSRPRIPYPTGILAVLTFLIFFSLFESLVAKAPWSLQAIGLMVSVVLLSAVSFIDDRAPLPSSLRLFVHAFVALLIFLTGTRIFTLTNPLENFTGIGILNLNSWKIPSAMFHDPSIVGALFTIFWLGLTTHALNWFDGIRGQVSVLSVIGFSTIGILSLSSRVGDLSLGVIAFILAGTAAGCVFFDVPPPRALLGDTGAMFFGLMLGVLTIFTGGKVATGFLVLGVPLIDSFIVIARRVTKGKSPFKGNAVDEHLHHRLLRRGWSEWQIVVLTASLGTAFGVTALFLDTVEKFLAAIILFVIMVALSMLSGQKSSS